MGGSTTATQDASNEYDGTNWTAGGDMNSARDAFMTATQGTQTATLAAGGGPAGANCETYDGSSWTEVGNFPVACSNNKGGGTQTNAVSYGGEPPGGVPAGVEAYTWDGTSWTASANMTKHRIQLAGSGTATAALAISGVQPGLISDTEEWHNTFKVVTAGAWASGGNLNSARWGVGNFGTQTAAVAHGGAPATALVEEYDGSSWTEVNNVPAAGRDPAGLGTLTAGLALGGGDDPKYTTATKEYDGTNWTEGGAMNTARGMCGTGGTQTAGLAFAGEGLTAAIAKTEEYNGTSWTANPNDFPSSVATHGGGTQTAAIGVAEAAVNTFEYDGSSWTSGGAVSVALSGANAGGSSQTDILRYGGSTPAPALNTVTEGYDGTSWSTRPNMATGRVYIGKGNIGTTSSSLGVGGYISGASNATEEFTGETSADTAKTIDFD
jgi:hypothetical protein